jgi:hypothetical protein
MRVEDAMIELTEEQRQELDTPGPVRARDPVTKETYVLVRTQTYERLEAILAEDSILATAEMVDRVMAEDDANDPHLAEYQRLYNGGAK